eukprot:12925204-Prorocentrum_lima.AAC.1
MWSRLAFSWSSPGLLHSADLAEHREDVSGEPAVNPRSANSSHTAATVLPCFARSTLASLPQGK